MYTQQNLKSNSRAMNNDLLYEELQTVQQYIRTMFSAMPSVHQPYQQHQILEQTISYGRKIIELSEKFTAKYRKEHYTDRRDVQNKIRDIYLLVSKIRQTNDKMYLESDHIDQMVEYIFTVLKEEMQKDEPIFNDLKSRTSYAQSNSRLTYAGHPLNNQGIRQYASDKNQFEIMRSNDGHDENQMYNDGKKQTLAKKKRSNTNKSKKKESNSIDLKTALSIQKIFEEEEQQMHKIFQKISKILYSNPQLNVSAIQEKLSFSKVNKNDENKGPSDLETIDFIRSNVQNNIKSLSNVSNAIQLLDQHYGRKGKMEGYTQGKFNLYLEQINKREQVYSYSVSKLLQNISNLRENLDGHNVPVAALTILDGLEDIGNKFYELYPSHSVLKDLKVQKLAKQFENSGFQNQAVQVSLGKSEKTVHREISESRRIMLELFRVSTRINEFIQRFQKSIKYKKNLEAKEIQKFIQALKQSLPRKEKNIPTSVKEQAYAYQEELKKLLDSHEKIEKQKSQQFNKKVKKAEKRNIQLENIIEQLSNELSGEKEHRQSQKKKHKRKLQSQIEQNRKLLQHNSKLQTNVKQLSKQLDRLKSQIKIQYEKFCTVEKQQTEAIRKLHKTTENQQKQLETYKKQIQQNLHKYEEQKQVYHNKIIILETKQENSMEEQIRLKEQLETMIDTNSKLEKQINQLSEIYEEKIRELEYVIENIKELEEELKTREDQYNELDREKAVIVGKLENQTKIGAMLQTENNRLIAELESARKDVEKYRSLAVLNENDISVLKQEIEKVKSAYFQADEQVESSKNYMYQVQKERDRLKKQNRDYKAQIEQLTDRSSSNELIREKIERQFSGLKDDLSLRNRQYDGVVRDVEDLKKQNQKHRKQIGQYRDTIAKNQTQIRQLRQQLQKKTETQSVENGKRKLELEATRVQLRKKTEQLQKQRASYEEKLELLQSKNKEMSQFISQKQLLAKITNSHLSQ